MSLGIQHVYEMLFNTINVCLTKYRQIISDFMQNDTNSAISFETLDLCLQIPTMKTSDTYNTANKAFQMCMYSIGTSNSNLFLIRSENLRSVLYFWYLGHAM
jgi:hypothetical protein